MGLQLFADRLGRDPRERLGRLEFRIGLAPGIDETADVLLDRWAEFLRRLASAKVVGVEAADAAAEFAEPGLDRGAAPAEHRLGMAGRTSAVLTGHFGLESPTLESRQQFRRRQNGLASTFREWFHRESPP
jgi:hypothetical protein